MVSMKDIAQRCGVSVATVSKAINGQQDIGEATRKRILSEAKKMGYTPNAAARSLKTRRTNNLGILFMDLQYSGFMHEYFASMLNYFRMEAEQRAELAVQDGVGAGMTAEKALITAKAAFYRAAITGGDVKKAYEGLGGIPAATADLGYGENLLPKNVSSELLTEPVEENSLREVEPVSNISGLEEPKLMFNIEDAEGDTVAYGRFKTKIVATVKDTVLHGTDTDLVGAIEAALRSGLAIKEKMRAFAPATGSGAYDAAHKHMSFYQENDGVTAIKTVTGTNLISAIINAWADLPEAFAANAKCVMRKQDYFREIRDLANNNDTLWGKKPEDVIGIPVIFNDRAVTPVVGDFRYSKQNYDIGTIYETDKDAKKGEYYFVLTAWGDHQIRLKSAFRLAKVGE